MSVCRQQSDPSMRCLSAQQTLQEVRQRVTAVLSCGWNVESVVERLPFVARVLLNRITIFCNGLTVGCRQLGMVERRRLCDSARVGKAVAQKINQVLFFLQSKANDADIGVHNFE